MTARLSAVTFDCADAGKLASFWAELVGATVAEGATAESASLEGPDAPAWYFTQVPEPKTAKNRFHPDLLVDDLDAEVARASALGATVVGSYGDDTRWTTLRDLEGNEFCLVAG